ncbi:hypothetical protein ACEPAF_1300 [Sanghuangporus sanghuang]
MMNMANRFALLFAQLGCATVCLAQSALFSIESVVSVTSSATVLGSESGVASFTPPVSSLSTSTVTSAPATIVTSLPGSSTTTSSAIPTSAPFVPIGTIPRNYTPEVLEELWSLVGEVVEPPFTTTAEATIPVTLPSSAPPVYPTWYARTPGNILPNIKLPKNFKFGVATAAYQVEGATKLEGKGPSGWDWAGRQEGVIVDGSNGDVTDLQYLLYKGDTARTAALELNAHSFSISWARIFPFGTRDSPVNQQGLDHYSDLIDYSISLGIEPVVTLFHWDMPLALSAFYGGLTSEEFVVDFEHYARTVFEAYNGRVRTWYTFNEPHVYCQGITTYPFNTTLSPNVTVDNAQFHCAYYLLRAHAKAVKAFREMGIEGEIAFKNDGFVGKPWRTNTTEDFEAVERNVAFWLGMYSDPVYGSGDWPDIMKETLNETMLPRFTDEQKEEIKGSADFFAIDLYRSVFVAAPENGIVACVANSSDPNWPVCNVQMTYDAATGWPVGIAATESTTWLFATPQNVRSELKEMRRRWPYNKIYISEFGFGVPEEGIRTDLALVLDDAARVDYYMTMLGESLLAIHEDNIPLQGVFAWSMVDNAEWLSGFSTRFGIQYVNYTTLERRYKRSAIALSEFFASHK